MSLDAERAFEAWREKVNPRLRDERWTARNTPADDQEDACPACGHADCDHDNDDSATSCPTCDQDAGPCRHADWRDR